MEKRAWAMSMGQKRLIAVSRTLAPIANASWRQTQDAHHLMTIAGAIVPSLHSMCVLTCDRLQFVLWSNLFPRTAGLAGCRRSWRWQPGSQACEEGPSGAESNLQRAATKHSQGAGQVQLPADCSEQDVLQAADGDPVHLCTFTSVTGGTPDRNPGPAADLPHAAHGPHRED